MTTGEVNNTDFLYMVPGWRESQKVSGRKLMSLTRAKLWWLDDRIRAYPKRVVLGLQLSVSINTIYQYSFQGRNRGDPATRLIDAGSKGWPVWSNPAEKLLQLKLQRKLMLVLIEMCQNTQGIAVCCIWGCIADQSECPCWPVHCQKLQQWESEYQNWTREKWKEVARSDESRFLHVDGRVLMHSLPGEHMVSEFTTMFSMGNLGFCHLCGCYFDTYHLPKQRPRKHFHGNCNPWWLWPLSTR